MLHISDNFAYQYFLTVKEIATNPHKKSSDTYTAIPSFHLDFHKVKPISEFTQATCQEQM